MDLMGNEVNPIIDFAHCVFIIWYTFGIRATMARATAMGSMPTRDDAAVAKRKGTRET